jgi:hypothetical protein
MMVVRGCGRVRRKMSRTGVERVREEEIFMTVS